MWEQDFENFAKLGIGQELLREAGVRRVTTEEARQLGIIYRARADLAGIYFAYHDPVTGTELAGRLRRDHPEVDLSGKPIAKYLSGAGKPQHLYFAPGATGSIRDPAVPAVFVEAEKSVLAITAASRRLGRPLLPIGTGGCYGWRGRRGQHVGKDGHTVDVRDALADFDHVVWENRAAAICFDANVATNRQVQTARRRLVDELQRRGARVQTVDLPPRSGVNGPDDFIAVAGAEALFALLDGAGDAARKKGGGMSKAARAVALFQAQEGVELFHAPDGETFARIPANGHSEVHMLRGRSFRRHLGHLFYRREGGVLGVQALKDAVAVLDSTATFDGPERPVYTRVARVGNRIFVDLGDPAWRVIEVSGDGWEVVTRGPVDFRRAAGTLPLPLPSKGGRLDTLWEFLNVEDNPSRTLILGWVVAVMRGEGPYPILVLTGEAGCAKSNTARMVRTLFDPNTTLLRDEPADARDLAVAAANNFVLAFDNLSWIDRRFSDRLCRLATGGGFATRQLYTDDDEIVFPGLRPVILNGIGDFATRGDLLDRAILLALPVIPPERRKPEQRLWRDFDAAHPLILGAFLDALVAALREGPAELQTALPRMADVASWVSAAEPALGLQRGAFIDALTQNVEVASEVALDDATIGELVRALAETPGGWEGTPTELLNELENRADERTKRQRGWPRTASMVGTQLRRIAPNLRRTGYGVELDRCGHDRRRRITLTKPASNAVRTDRTDRDRRDGPGPEPESPAARPNPVTSSGDGEENPADGGGPGADGAPARPASAVEADLGASHLESPNHVACADSADGRGPNPIATYAICAGQADVERYVTDALSDGRPVAADWETSSLNLFDGSLRPVGLALSVAPGSALYIPIGHEGGQNIDLPGLRATLEVVGAHCPIICHNYAFDGAVFRQVLDWEPSDWHDTMIAAHLLDSKEKQVGLKAVVKRLFGVEMVTYDAVSEGQRLSALDATRVGNYAGADADYTRRLWLDPRVRTAVGEQRAIYDLERRMVAVLRDAQTHQLFIDRERLTESERQVRDRIRDLSDELNIIAGRPINPKSVNDVSGAIARLGLSTGRRTSTGKPSTNRHALEALASRHPFFAALLQYRTATSLHSTLNRLRATVEDLGEGLRFAFRGIGAPTGRMSSSGTSLVGGSVRDKGVAPINVQGIPKRPTTEGVNVRALFRANPKDGPEEFVLVALDYSQVELRVAANLSREETWIETFRDPDGDIHLTNARLAFGNPALMKANTAERDKGKIISFAILYGGSSTTVAQQAGIPEAKAAQLVTSFRKGTPTLHRWMQSVQEKAASTGRVATAFGRVRRFPEFGPGGRASESERRRASREAVNTVVQGTAADVFKIACCQVYEALQQRGALEDCHPVLFIHDELVLRVRASRVHDLIPVVADQMRVTLEGWQVPLVVEARRGSDWGNLAPLDIPLG